MKRRVFTNEFKGQATSMVLVEKCKPSEVSRNLGITESTLQNWLRAARLQGSDVAGASASESALRELRVKLRQAEMERDILKKAVVFFAKG